MGRSFQTDGFSDDDSVTDLPGGIRISKKDILFEALGALDELNAALGLLRAALHPSDSDGSRQIETIQRDLIQIGAEVATGQPHLAPESRANLDHQTANLENRGHPRKGFDLPGANEASARAHWARVVCRRAERNLALAQAKHPERITTLALAYLNRLSGFLFHLAQSLAAAG